MKKSPFWRCFGSTRASFSWRVSLATWLFELILWLGASYWPRWRLERQKPERISHGRKSSLKTQKIKFEELEAIWLYCPYFSFFCSAVGFELLFYVTFFCLLGDTVDVFGGGFCTWRLFWVFRVGEVSAWLWLFVILLLSELEIWARPSPSLSDRVNPWDCVVPAAVFAKSSCWSSAVNDRFLRGTSNGINSWHGSSTSWAPTYGFYRIPPF